MHFVECNLSSERERAAAVCIQFRYCIIHEYFFMLRVPTYSIFYLTLNVLILLHIIVIIILIHSKS